MYVFLGSSVPLWVVCVFLGFCFEWSKQSYFDCVLSASIFSPFSAVKMLSRLTSVSNCLQLRRIAAASVPFRSNIAFFSEVARAPSGDTVTPNDAAKTPEVKMEVNPNSLTQRLKRMDPDHKLLEYLDELKVGILNKRQARVKVARRLTPILRKGEREKGKATKPAPVEKVFPFKKPGWVLGSVEKWSQEEADKLVSAPYIAVIGRSNVGKSTLVNSIVNFDFSFVQRSAVSSKPGETKALSFFGLGKIQEETKDPEDNSVLKTIRPALVLADLPGYGFALMNDEDRQRCEDLTYDYFLHGQFDPTQPRNLRRILVLLDARHGMKVSDRQFLVELSAKVQAYHEAKKQELGRSHLKKLSWKIQFVLTKCDLVERLDLCRRMMLLKQEYTDIVPAQLQSDLPIIPVSSRDGSGILALQRELSSLVPPLAPVDVSDSSDGKKKAAKRKVTVLDEEDGKKDEWAVARPQLLTEHQQQEALRLKHNSNKYPPSSSSASASPALNSNKHGKKEALSTGGGANQSNKRMTHDEWRELSTQGIKVQKHDMTKGERAVVLAKKVRVSPALQNSNSRDNGAANSKKTAAAKSEARDRKTLDKRRPAPRAFDEDDHESAEEDRGTSRGSATPRQQVKKQKKATFDASSGPKVSQRQDKKPSPMENLDPEFANLNRAARRAMLKQEGLLTWDGVDRSVPNRSNQLSKLKNKNNAKDRDAKGLQKTSNKARDGSEARGARGSREAPSEDDDEEHYEDVVDVRRRGRGSGGVRERAGKGVSPRGAQGSAPGDAGKGRWDEEYQAYVFDDDSDGYDDRGGDDDDEGDYEDVDEEDRRGGRGRRGGAGGRGGRVTRGRSVDRGGGDGEEEGGTRGGEGRRGRGRGAGMPVRRRSSFLEGRRSRDA